MILCDKFVSINFGYFWWEVKKVKRIFLDILIFGQTKMSRPKLASEAYEVTETMQAIDVAVNKRSSLPRSHALIPIF